MRTDLRRASLVALAAVAACAPAGCGGGGGATERVPAAVRRDEAQKAIFIHRYCAYYARSTARAPGFRRCLRDADWYWLTEHADEGRPAIQFAFGNLETCGPSAGPRCAGLARRYRVRLAQRPHGGG